MKDIQVKDTMVPISNCLTVRKDENLVAIFDSLKQSQLSQNKPIHKDAIVVDENDEVIGKVNIIDIFWALEPNYRKVKNQHRELSGFSSDFVLQAARDFNLWMEPTQSLRERAKNLSVSDVMHLPEKIEYIKETDSLARAMHAYVMGVHQPLLVKDSNNKIIGVSRLGDIFEAFSESLTI